MGGGGRSPSPTAGSPIRDTDFRSRGEGRRRVVLVAARPPCWRSGGAVGDLCGSPPSRAPEERSVGVAAVCLGCRFFLAMLSVREATVCDLLQMQQTNLWCLPENYNLKYYFYHILS